MSSPQPLSPEDAARRAATQRRRSIALALVLAGVVVLFYVLTIIKMGPGMFNRAL